jgi:hypothetical protein
MKFSNANSKLLPLPSLRTTQPVFMPTYSASSVLETPVNFHVLASSGDATAKTIPTAAATTAMGA